MTIAVGFPCIDGIVLCADTQMTCAPSGMKYSDAKIHTIGCEGTGNDWAVGIAYAGDEGMFKEFFGRVRQTLEGEAFPRGENKVNKHFIVDTIREALEQAHAQSPDVDSEYVDVICGVSVNGKTSMHVGKRTLFYEEQAPAYIGTGNRSLSRFLASTLPLTGRPLFAKNALVAGVYMVNQAKDFVYGCGGETQAILIKDSGLPDRWGSGEKLSVEEALAPIAEHMQRAMKELFGMLISPEGEKNALEREIKSAKEKISAFYESP